MEHLHTDGYGEDDALTTVRVGFQAIALDHGYEYGLEDKTTYQITAGAEYGHGEYIWITQAEVTTDFAHLVGSIL